MSYDFLLTLLRIAAASARGAAAVTVCLLFALVPAARAQESMVVNNGPFITTSSWNLTSYSLADDFTLRSRASIDTIRFWAIDYSNDQNLSNFSGTMSWFIGRDTDNKPGAVMASGFSSAITVDDTGMTSSGNVLRIFQLDIPTDNLTLDSGTYWLHLKEGTPTETGDTSVIQWVVRDGHSGEGFRFDSDPMNPTAWDSSGGTTDLAFQLLNSPNLESVETPEPGSAALLVAILLPAAGASYLKAQRNRSRHNRTIKS